MPRDMSGCGKHIKTRSGAKLCQSGVPVDHTVTLFVVVSFFHNPPADRERERKEERARETGNKIATLYYDEMS